MEWDVELFYRTNVVIGGLRTGTGLGMSFEIEDGQKRAEPLELWASTESSGDQRVRRGVDIPVGRVA